MKALELAVCLVQYEVWPRAGRHSGLWPSCRPKLGQTSYGSLHSASSNAFVSCSVMTNNVTEALLWWWYYRFELVPGNYLRLSWTSKATSHGLSILGVEKSASTAEVKRVRGRLEFRIKKKLRGTWNFMIPISMTKFNKISFSKKIH